MSFGAQERIALSFLKGQANLRMPNGVSEVNTAPVSNVEMKMVPKYSFKMSVSEYQTTYCQ